PAHPGRSSPSWWPCRSGRIRGRPAHTWTRSSVRSRRGRRKTPWLHRRQLARLADLADGQLGAHSGLAPVLVGDQRGDADRRGLRVEGVDDIRVLLDHEAAADLARAGNLLIVGVELLVQEHVLVDARALG